MSRPKSPMSNPFAPDATKAALRALTQPVTPIAEPEPEPQKSENPTTQKIENVNTQKNENVNTQKLKKAEQLGSLGPRTIVLSDADMLTAQEFGYLRGCRDLSAVFRAALECLIKTNEAGLVEIEFERKTGDRGGRPVYAHTVRLKEK